MDGALYNNCPAKIAYLESRAIWRDVEHCHPDILLSLGTGHNGKDTRGTADPSFGTRESERPKVAMPLPEPTERRNAFGQWFKNVSLVQIFQVLVNRVDNALSSEQMWHEFRTWVLDSSTNAIESRRFTRINPYLGLRLPRLDEKDQMESLRNAVVEKLRRNAGFRQRIARIAHRLISSCFYFDKREAPIEGDGYHLCKGTALQYKL